MRRSSWHGACASVASTALLQILVSTWAGTNTWTKIGPDGGSVYTLAMDPRNPQTVYASTDNGLFKTIDGGANGAPCVRFSAAWIC